MANYIVTDSDLTAIANQIRNLTGKSDSITFPGQFISNLKTIAPLSEMDVTEKTMTHSTTYNFGNRTLAAGQGFTVTGESISFPSGALLPKTGSTISKSNFYSVAGQMTGGTTDLTGLVFSCMGNLANGRRLTMNYTFINQTSTKKTLSGSCNITITIKYYQSN